MIENERNGEYGFIVSASLNNSTINVTSHAEKDYFAISELASGFTVSGTITEQNKAMDATDPLKCHVTILKVNDKGSTSPFDNYDVDSVNITCINEDTTNPTETFNWTVKLSNHLKTFDKGNYIFNLFFTSKNAGGVESTKDFVLNGDNAPPTLEVINPEFWTKDQPKTEMYKQSKPLVTEATASYSESEDTPAKPLFTLKGKWSDVGGSGTKTVYYSTTSTTKPASLPNSDWTAVSEADAPQGQKNSSWSQQFDFVEGENKQYAVFAVDSVGNSTDITVLTQFNNIMFDGAVPEVEIDEYSAVTNGGDSGKLTITGNASDTYMLAEAAADVIKLEARKTPAGGTLPTATATKAADNKSATWTFDIATEGEWEIGVRAKDKAGRLGKTEIVKVTFDKTKPVFGALNLERRLANGGKENVASTALVNTTKKWFKSTAINVNGNFTDNLSGVEAVYCWINIEPTASDPLTKDNASTVIGVENDGTTKTKWNFGATVSGFDVGENKVYFAAVDKAGNMSTINADPYYVYVDMSIPTVTSDITGTGLTNAKKAEKYTGKVADDASGVVKYKFVLVNDDDATISLTVDETNTTAVTLGASNEEEKTDPSTTPPTKYKEYERVWTVNLTEVQLKKLGDDAATNDKTSAFTAYGYATDAAENESGRVRLFALQIDTKAPTGNIVLPADESVVNKEFNIQGNANDETSLKRVTLKYKKNWTDSDKTYTDFTPDVIKFEDNYAYNWTQKVDSATAFGSLTSTDPWEVNSTGAYTGSKKFDSTNSTSITVQAFTEDEAGNSADGIIRKFLVNQHSDRPIINVTTITEPGGIAKYTTVLKGTVKDDDNDGTKVVTRFVASSVPFEASDFDGGKLKTGTLAAKYGKTDFTPATGDWTFTPADTTDGEKTVYFYVEDNAGTVFYYGKDDSLERPYLIFQGKEDERRDVKNGDETGLKFGIDSNAPVIKDPIALCHGDNETVYDAASTDPIKKYSLLEGKSSGYVGGTEANYLKITLTAADDKDGGKGNGIKKIEAYIYDSDNNEKAKKIETTDAKSVDFEWDVGQIKSTAQDATKGWEDGTYNITVTVTDGADMTTSKRYLFSVDFTAPDVDMTSPAVDKTKTPAIYTNLVASATLKANFSDAGIGTATGGVKWLIPTLAQQALTGANKQALINDKDKWKDGATDTTFNKKLEWKDISTYSNTTASTGFAKKIGDADADYDESNRGNLVVPVWFRTEDKLGNIFVREEKIVIDTDASLAKATIVSPLDGGKIGSSVTLNGTASVDEGIVQEVRLKIDADGNGTFDINDFLILSGLLESTDNLVKVSDTTGTVLKNLQNKWGQWAAKNSTATKKPRLVAKDKTGEDLLETKTKEITNKNGTKEIDVVKFKTGKTKADVAEWYVVADDTNSWKLAIESDLFNSTYIKPTGDDGNPKITFKAVAYDGRLKYNASGEIIKDANGKQSEHIRDWPAAIADTVVTDKKVAMFKVTVDPDVPLIENVYLVQYDSTDKTKTVVSRAYEAGMYISNSKKLGSKDGKWYLVAKLTDGAALSSFKVRSTNLTDDKTYTCDAENSEDDGWTYTADATTGEVKEIVLTDEVQITDEDTKEGRIYLEITATDKTGKVGAKYIDINIDNKAPRMRRAADIAANWLTTTEDTDSELTLTNTLNQELGETYFVENSDGSFTFGGTMSELGSGLAYLAFWFERQPHKTKPYLSEKRVYDPIRPCGEEKADKTYANQTKLGTAADGGLYINEDGLAVKKVNVGRSGDTKTLTVTADDNIRKGSLVKIGGAYVMIESISGTTVTLASDVETKFTEAELVYAQIVNRMGIEPGEGSAYDGLCDGDGMIEMIKFKNGLYTWTGDIESKNIPDGPIIIHAVAIDEAGNLESGIVTTKVANNRPRVTRVMVGTDWNGSNKFKIKDTYQNVQNVADIEKATPSGTQFGEFVYYSTIDRTLEDKDHPENEDVMAKAVVTLNGGSPFVVSKELCVIPRFTGGNGVLKYGWNVTTTEENTPVSGTQGLKSTADDLNIDTEGISNATLAQLIQDTKVGAAYKYGGLIIDTGLDDTSNVKKLAKHESWLKNKTKAEAWNEQPRYFNFTFWDATQETDQGTDSLYALVRLPAIVNVIDDIAPEAFIQPFYWNDWDDSSTVMAGENKPAGHIDLEADIEKDNPGVSGQIYIEGYVKDDTRLGGIYITTPDNNASGSETYKIATYAGGNWTKETPAGSHVKVIDIEDVQEPSQTGHIAYYRVAVDMTKYGVRDSQKVYVSAIDSNTSVETDKIHGLTVTGNASVAGTTQTTERNNAFREDGIINDGYTDLYTMDFVPYIQSVDGKYRSRLGRYPVRAGETIKINGMNFAAGATYAVKFYQSGVDGKQGTENSSWAAPTDGKWTGTIPDDGYIEITAPQYSAFVEVTVSSLKQTGVSKKTQNNTNKNSVGYNVQKGKYTYEGKVNPKFKPDAVPGADYWTDDCYLSVWNVETKIDKSTNPRSGVVKKFMADNARLQGNKTNSLTDYTGLKDHHMALWSSDDLQQYRTIAGHETINRAATLTSQSQAQFRVPVPAINYTMINGRAWYVALDNYVGGDSANSWGSGLFLGCDKFEFNRGFWNGTNTAEETQYLYVIERQGKNLPAENRNSEDGYDSVLEQFKNPHITGWYDPTAKLDKFTGVAHIYISYYDSYARCLKYAYYKTAGNDDLNPQDQDGKWGTDGEKSIEAVVRSSGSSTNRTGGYAVVAGYDTTISNPTDFKEQAGEWNDIVVTSDHMPVIVYYNKEIGKLQVACGTVAAPKTGRVNGSGGDGQWVKSTIIPDGAGDFGRYCSAVIDKNDNLHVAAQDADNGHLWYLFLKKSGSTYTLEKQALVDKTSSVGRWTSIALAAPNSVTATEPYLAKPVISYIDTSFLNTRRAVKAAYVYSIKEDGETTYMWDAITDPAIYEANDQLTSVMADVYESVESGSKKGMIGVGFNSNMYAIDFLRDEK